MFVCETCFVQLCSFITFFCFNFIYILSHECRIFTFVFVFVNIWGVFWFILDKKCLFLVKIT